MDWTEISVEIPAQRIDEASAIANMTVPYGIYIEDYSQLEDEVREIARKSLVDFEEYNLWAKPGMDEVLRALKARGQNLYVLSNASLRFVNCWRRKFPCPELWDGVLFSAEVKCIKPQRYIYEIFFDRFGLVPEECFFIDDLQRNIDASLVCGMDGWAFRSGDVEELKRVLEIE